MEKEFMIGKTQVIINTSYLDSRSEEQAKIDELMLIDAIWGMYDEMDEAV